MGYTFTLKPKNERAYGDDERREMEAYVRRLPHVFQRADSCFVLARNDEIRDWIVERGLTEESHEGFEHIWIKKDRVLIDVHANGPGLQVVKEFLDWAMARWPAELYDEQEIAPMSPEEFLRATGATH